MAGIKLDLKNTGISQKSIMEYKEQVENIHKDLHRRANDENDFVGWLELPTNFQFLQLLSLLGKPSSKYAAAASQTTNLCRRKPF